MCKGAQHKVYSTMYNILGPVSLIRYTRVGTDSSGHLRPHEASAVIAITRDRHSGHTATAFVHVCAHLRVNVVNVVTPSRAAEMTNEFLQYPLAVAQMLLAVQYGTCRGPVSDLRAHSSPTA